MTHPKTMDELNVFELHQKVPKQRTKQKRKKRRKNTEFCKNLSLSRGASNLGSYLDGWVEASSLMLTSSKLVWRRELVAAFKFSLMELKSTLGKFQQRPT